MKKIVIVGPAYPYRGGQALVEAHLYETLSKAGYDCHTITFTLLYPEVFFPGKTQYDQSEQTYFGHQERIERIINSVNPITWVKAANRIAEIQPDLTIFVWWMPFFGPAYSTIASMIKRKTNTKIAFLVENYISHENRWFDKAMSKFTLDMADGFIAQSKFIKKQVGEVHKQPIHETTLSVFDCYNNNAYDKASAREFLGIKTKNVVLFFGLIRRYKGLDKLILGFNEIKEKYPDNTLLIVGECYEDITYYEKLIEQEGLQDCSILINKFIDNEKVEPYFKAADVVALPYNSATQSGILMMAYGFNVPVVVNDVGGLKELIVEGKTGRATQGNDPSIVAEGVTSILDRVGTEDFETNIRELNQNLGYGNLEGIVQQLMG